MSLTLKSFDIKKCLSFSKSDLIDLIKVLKTKGHKINITGTKDVLCDRIQEIKKKEEKDESDSSSDDESSSSEDEPDDGVKSEFNPSLHYTLPELKQICKKYGLPVGGNKKDRDTMIIVPDLEQVFDEERE